MPNPNQTTVLEAIHEFSELGVQAFLPKPFAVDALVGTVDAMLGLAP